MIAQEKIISITDDSLLQSLRNNDSQAFEEIFKRYWSRLFLYAYNILKDKEICEDIIQEIFADLWKRRNENIITNLSSFLYQSVKYQIFKYFRKKKVIKQYESEFNYFQSQFSLEDLAEFEELSDKIEELIEELPEKRRLIFRLSRFESLPNKEIAKKLNISLQTVKNEISKGLKYIRESVQNIYMLIF
jgi:RNA polymerase sigma-70 factor (family 1)